MLNFYDWFAEAEQNQLPTPIEIYTKYFKPIGWPGLVFRELWPAMKKFMDSAVTNWKEPAENGLHYLMTDNSGPASWQKMLSSKWSLQKIKVNPFDFDQETQQQFLERGFGQVAASWSANDLQRTTTQQSIISSQLSGNNQPVLIIINQNKHNLIEGWHRTMTILLQGKPGELQVNDVANWGKWNRVLLQAWVAMPGQRSPSFQT